MPDSRPVSHCLLDLAPPDIAWFQERSDIVLVPIGSCEQHGPHLPLDTDTRIVLFLANIEGVWRPIMPYDGVLDVLAGDLLRFETD